MLKFEVNGKRGSIIMNLPTKLSEITPEYLNEVTSNVVVADNYSLIGILYRESLASVMLANNRKQKNITTAVVPVFVKAGTTDTEYIKNMSCGDKIIIAPSDIAIGHDGSKMGKGISLSHDEIAILKGILDEMEL